jgi:predicted ATP-grasp superfamily ATP-dependent carboligase|tara:strand:+ start:920 stop:2164 length:1245 start_codon:yes stop_codon:yes gene_type:complete
MQKVSGPGNTYRELQKILVRSGQAEKAPAWIFGSSINTLSFVRSLGRRGIPCVVLDRLPMIGAESRFTHFVPISLSDLSSEEGIACLRHAAKSSTSKPVIFATSDEHNEFLARHGGKLEEHCRFLVPRPETIDLVLNKREQYTIAEKIGVPLPLSLYPESLEDIVSYKDRMRFPCIIKPCMAHVGRQLLGGKKVRVVETYDDLKKQWGLLGSRSSEFMIQEIIPGGDSDLFGYLALWSHDCQEIAWVTKQKLRQNPPEYGDGALQKTVICEEARELSKRLLKELGYQGFVGVEFKKDPRDGRLKLMEINPRTVSGNQLAISSNIDFPYIAYNYLTDPEYCYSGSFKPDVSFINEDWNFRAYIILRKKGRMRLTKYLSELFNSDSRAIWAWDDLRPAWCTFRVLFRDMIRKLRKF